MSYKSLGKIIADKNIEIDKLKSCIKSIVSTADDSDVETGYPEHEAAINMAREILRNTAQ